MKLKDKILAQTVATLTLIAMINSNYLVTNEKVLLSTSQLTMSTLLRKKKLKHFNKLTSLKKWQYIRIMAL